MSGSQQRNVQSALKALHYADPLLVLGYLLCARTVATCLLHEPSKKSAPRPSRYGGITLLAIITATLVAEAVSYFIESLLHRGRWASQDCVVYILVSISVYGSTFIGLLENKRPLWHPVVGASVVAAVLEIILAAVHTIAQPATDGFAFSRIALHFARALLLVCASLLVLWTALSTRRARTSKARDETAPLLANGVDRSAEGNGLAPGSNYGATAESDEDSKSHHSVDTDVDSDDDTDPQALKELRAKQQQRLKEAGSWLAYLKGFKVFLPMLLPGRDDRYIKACLAVVGLLLLVDRALNVLVPRQLGIITDELTRTSGTGEFPWKPALVWMVLTWLSSRTGVDLFRDFAQIPVDQFARKKISITAFAHVMNLDMAFHSNKNSGELISAIDQGHALQDFLEFACYDIIPMFIDLIVAFWYVASLFDITMSYILGIVAVVYAYIGAKTTAWAAKSRSRRNQAWRDEAKVQNEALNNWQTVSHFNRAQYECKRYNDTIDELNRTEIKFFYAYYIGSASQNLVMLLGQIGVTFLAIYRISRGEVPLGNLVTLLLYWGSIQGPLARVSYSVRRITIMMTDSERLLQLLTTKPKVSDAPGAIDLNVDEGHVEFEHVDFSYDPRKLTLKDVSFVAKPGQTIALVGETGGGKSTVLKMLYRYYDIDSGAIRIDGQDIRAVTLDSLRDSFGMVPQDPSLFNISIMENVRYAKLDATDAEVMEACKAAAIHDKILTFPDGYKATVGERGVKLSGGELQRVSIARAILRQPKIVLLDEATSMIDAETEGLIQEAFKRLTANRTTFIIAHRLATIQHADRICVIHDGRIVESGTHDELFRNKGKYVALWSRQLSKDVKEVEEKLATAAEDRDLIGRGEAPGDDA